MVVGLVSIELHLPAARSLKDKRMVLQSLKGRLRKFNVAIAEIDDHDLWQRAALGVVTIATSRAHADRDPTAVVDEVERVEPGLITGTQVEFLA